jgi:hypothetical protein
MEELYNILASTTIQLRKGDPITEERHNGINVVTINAMPHVSAAEMDDTIAIVDMELLAIGVDKAAAQDFKAELIALLDAWPDPEELANGPSFIAVGATIGDQGAAFQLFALGEVLELWKVVTPATLGLSGEKATAAAGLGYVMITGYRKSRP